MATECNNINKELYSRPAILEIILNEFGQAPLTFLELLGNGTGAEFYATWLNIYGMVLVEKDKKKFKEANLTSLLFDKCKFYNCFNTDLNDYFLFHAENSWPLDVINLDFCGILFDNGTDDCTIGIIDNMFKNGIPKDGGLIFFTFQTTGFGANFSKNAIKNRNDMISAISGIAAKHNWDIEEKLYYQYKSSKPTTMCNLGIKVMKRKLDITGE